MVAPKTSLLLLRKLPVFIHKSHFIQTFELYTRILMILFYKIIISSIQTQAHIQK